MLVWAWYGNVAVELLPYSDQGSILTISAVCREFVRAPKNHTDGTRDPCTAGFNI